MKRTQILPCWILTWKSGASSAASLTDTGVGFSPCGATGPKGRFMDGVKNAALKGRSSTVQKMFVEPKGLAFI
jgi:hypothetical protein